jgi:DNA-binding NtrC family response regulator
MTRVLVVQRDPAVAERIAADLGRAGYETELCGGPEREPCPIGSELPCPLVDRADVLVYDAWVAGDSDGGHQLISHLRDVYADLPVILTSTTSSLDWVRTGSCRSRASRSRGRSSTPSRRRSPTRGWPSSRSPAGRPAG